MSAFFTFVLGLCAVVGAFGFIIFIHEMGHFLTARAVDIRCPQFAIGFGPVLFGFRWRGTNFAVRLFPLGGYVLMNGEEPGSRVEDPWSAAVAQYLGEESFPASPQSLLQKLEAIPESERGAEWLDVRDHVAFARSQEFPNLQSVEGNFHDRSIPARILVISGGVVMNFLATITILWCLSPLAGVGSFFNDWAAVVSQVVESSPAAQAGLKSGDRIISVNGRAVETYLEAHQAIGALPAQSFELGLKKRDGGEVVEKVTPMLAAGGQRFILDDKGELSLHDSDEHPDLTGKVVIEPKLADLLAVLRKDGIKEYQVTFAGEAAPTVFKLPESYKGPRGQIGVMFGVSDIRFETAFTVAVNSVVANSPAEKAGIKVGDLLYMVGGLPLVSNSEQGFGSLAPAALKAHTRLDDPANLELVVVRADKAEVLNVTEAAKISDLESLGVTLAPLTTGDRLKSPFLMIQGMLVMPYRILKAWLSNEYSGSEIVENMQGPIGIMQILYQISDNGVFQFLFFMAMLNAAIGAFNLLPFPALDGARLVFLFIAALRRDAIDPDKEAKVHLVGLLILLCFVVVVSFGDIRRLIASHLFVM